MGKYWYSTNRQAFHPYYTLNCKEHGLVCVRKAHVYEYLY